ncbi:MAG: hypothetical protein K9H49_04850 [Bacteroidales bacterium]|nr:hypothetical protein [Bacteroidales bacterium]MCF8389145.1 hypothetical protein [Bacteroidales bacterium]
MAIPRLFKLPRHRQFEYRPVFYNPEREEREARNKEIKSELGLDENANSEFKPGIRRGSMRHYIKSQKRSERNSTVRLVIILMLLFFAAFLLLYK